MQVSQITHLGVFDRIPQNLSFELWGQIVSVFSDGRRKIDALRQYGVTKDGNTKSLGEIHGSRFVTKEEYFSFREYKKFGKDHGFWHLTDWEADEELEDFLWQ